MPLANAYNSRNPRPNAVRSAESRPTLLRPRRRLSYNSGTFPVTSYKQQPCLRSPSPPLVLAGTPQVRPPPSRKGSTCTVSDTGSPRPSRKASSQHALQMTPGRGGAFNMEDVELSQMSTFSVRSEVSIDSRFSQLSRKSSSKHILSSQELEAQEIELRKQELRDLMRRNKTSCRKALWGGTSCATAGRLQCSTKVTVPKEFSFSAPPTPRGRRDLSPSSSESASRERRIWTADGSTNTLATSRSSRSFTALSSASTPGYGGGASTPGMVRLAFSKSKPPIVQPTIPSGPQLSTSQRAGRRRPASCPPEDSLEAKSSMSTTRPPTPERPPKAAPFRHTNAPPKTPAEERAQRARAVAAEKRMEENKRTKESHNIFKKRLGSTDAGIDVSVGSATAGARNRRPVGVGGVSMSAREGRVAGSSYTSGSPSARRTGGLPYARGGGGSPSTRGGGGPRSAKVVAAVGVGATLVSARAG
eukprot:TRINITY_DN24968_c0_g1_i2.p1 TRINITY_DN24968_c0_g1~~TRINITY_DN24968_c0_g1_i2.p1  ORF type:complete len:474 (+),score=57.73 TRINITY_DN24968_c0_g1_i2:283-1704(+)